MSEVDEQIGRNVARARTDRSMTQMELAERMQSRGWKWNQGTISTVENGERPLRLAEAHALAEIFELGPLGPFQLLQAEPEYRFRDALRRMREASDVLSGAADAYLTAQGGVAEAADSASLTEMDRNAAIDWVRRPPEQVVGERRAQAAREADAEWAAIGGTPAELESTRGRAQAATGPLGRMLLEEWERHGEHHEASER